MPDFAAPYQVHDSGPPIPRAKIGVYLALVCETMFFVGLLGAYVIVRFGSPSWPAPYLNLKGESITPPKLDLVAPIVNAAILTAGFIFSFLSTRAARRGDLAAMRRSLTLTLLFGVLFIAGVGYEFAHEAARGLTLWSGQYGAMTLFITASHAAHVLAGVVWLVVLLASDLSNPLGGVRADRVEHLGLYFGFVTFLWYVLLVLLYLL